MLVWLPVADSRADIILDWNAAFVSALGNELSSPPLGSRNTAILHTAIFDAVNSIEQTYRPFFVQEPFTGAASAVAAAAAAAHQVSVSLYPSQRAMFDPLLAGSLSGVPAGPERENGLRVGRSVANAILAWRADDGASTTVPYIPQTEPGAWRRTPPFFRPPDLPQWPQVTPFAMTNGSQFRPAGPPAFNSEEYLRDFNLTKELGAVNSTSRTAEQTLIARFWSDFSYTSTPPGHWNLIAAGLAREQTNSFSENVRLFALLNIALADAGIVSWDAKYEYNFWRPVTAIRLGDTDGNPLTQADTNWTSLLVSPAFPEYTSGHSTFSAAAAEILSRFYGTDSVRFEVSSDSLPGVVRTYDSLELAVEEIGMSRIYGGIHFLSADLDGIASGRRLGDYVSDNFLVPIPEPSAAWLFAVGTLLWSGLRRAGWPGHRRRK